MSNIQSQINNLHQILVKRLSNIREFPEDFLPHIVFVEEEVDGAPAYVKYSLTEIRSDAGCILVNLKTELPEERRLEEINIDWLITLWIWYEELIYPPKTILLPEKKLSVFLFPTERFERNATDEEIVTDYETDEGQDPCVEKYTPDELAAMLNDGKYINQNMFVRFIIH